MSVSIEKLDDTMGMLLDIFVELKALSDSSDSRDLRVVVNKFEVVKDRLIHNNLEELKELVQS